MPPKLRRKFFHYLPQIRYFLIGVLLGLFILALFKVLPPTVNFFKNLATNSSIVWSVIFQKELKVKQSEGRTNILLLGIPGGDHEGATLSDTIIFSSINLKTKDILLLSLPRDIWVASLNDKINTAYALGEEKRKGGGLVLAKAVVAEILGQPVHYAVRIDFSGFERGIDLLGGMDIEVERALDDYKYPLAGRENDDCEGDPEFLCRFEHLHFEKGWQHMDGKTALKYVRSRQAEGEEGTDFARSRRQQKLILALKEKALSAKTFLNPVKMLKLKENFGESLKADISEKEIDDFIKLALEINSAKIRTAALDTGDPKTGRPGLLLNPPIWEYGAWVLVPEGGNWEKVQEYVRCEIERKDPCL